MHSYLHKILFLKKKKVGVTRKVLIMLPEHLVRLKGIIIWISSRSLMNKDSP
jgi:hypothetical protein